MYGEREREGIPKKPDPSAALEIANHMNLPAEEVLYIGDSKQIWNRTECQDGYDRCSMGISRSRGVKRK